MSNNIMELSYLELCAIADTLNYSLSISSIGWRYTSEFRKVIHNKINNILTNTTVKIKPIRMKKLSIGGEDEN